FTPSTMGFDAWRLYDTIRLTRRPVECTTVLGVERVLGLVGLFTVILLFMPFAARITRGQSFGELVAAMKLPLAGATLFAVLILLRPGWFRGLLRLVPGGRARRFAASVIDSASAYSGRRRALLLALLLAVVGQITTTLMYFANAMSLATENVRVSEVLFAAAVMTFGTFVAPSASGEAVRELVFVWLLGTKAGAAKAFLIGNLGFWIEKIPLSVPGGLLLLLRRDPSLQAPSREDLERVRGLAVLLGIYLVAARARHDGGGSPYVTMPVERGPITAHVTATGSVNPVKTVQVGTYVSGPIQVISVDFNSPVQRGQLLAKI